MIKTREVLTKEAYNKVASYVESLGGKITAEEIYAMIHKPQIIIGDKFYILVSENNEDGPYGGDNNGPIAFETYLKDATLRHQIEQASGSSGKMTYGKLYIAELTILSEA
jgi:hypothetical protein